MKELVSIVRAKMKELFSIVRVKMKELLSIARVKMKELLSIVRIKMKELVSIVSVFSWKEEKNWEIGIYKNDTYQDKEKRRAYYFMGLEGK